MKGRSIVYTILKTIRIKARAPGRRAVLHPWVFEGEVVSGLSSDFDGEAVLCRDSKGRPLGSGLFNSRSKIVWRRFHPGRQDFSDEWIQKALEEAFRRRGLLDAPDTLPVGRLVWSDSDHLPGLIIDRYHDWLVIQALTLGVDRKLDVVAEHCRHLLKATRVLFRNDAPVREKEGLNRETRVYEGEGNDASTTEIESTGRWIQMNDMELWMDWKSGHKTGLYLDQREQYRAVAKFARGRRVLDAFCNEGGFGIACRKAGADEVTCVDSSADAIERLKKNARRNSVDLNACQENVFDYFSANRSASWDLVILDPPPFAPNRRSVPAALRGYKELNLRAMQSLSDGGILATYTCSHHVDWPDLQDVLEQAALDAGVGVRILEWCHQPGDHPVLLGFPESAYLRGFILEVRR